MLKIKEKFHKLIELSKNLLHKFPATIFVVVITTLFITICIDTELDNDFLQMMMLFFVSFFAGTFFTESFFQKMKWKIISFSVAGCVSVFFGWYLNSFANNVPEFWELFYIGYIVVLMLLGIYCLLKRSKLSFQEYITKVFSNMFFVSIVYGILAIGISLISWIFIELILDGDYDEILIRANLLLFGLYYVTGCIYAVSNVEKKEINIFIKNLIKFVLMPLVGVAIAVIYLYILKIFITGEIPSNVIFRICAILFVFAFPIWNMFEVVRDKENKISKIFSYAYVPLLVLEIYSLIVRIAALGITPVRYLGIFFIVFQIISLVLNFFWNKEKLPKLIVCAAILIALLTMTPITPSKVSAMNQLFRLEKYFPEGAKYSELDKDIQAKIYSAYDYLEYGDYFNRVPAYIKNQQEDILNFNDTPYNYSNDTKYEIYSHGKVNVSGYNYISEAQYYSYSYEDDESDLYLVSTDDDKYEISKKAVNEYIINTIRKSMNDETADSFDGLGKYSYYNRISNDNPYLKLENLTVYFSNIVASYEDEKLKVISMTGYILE